MLPAEGMKEKQPEFSEGGEDPAQLPLPPRTAHSREGHHHCQHSPCTSVPHRGAQPSVTILGSERGTEEMGEVPAGTARRTTSISATRAPALSSCPGPSGPALLPKSSAPAPATGGGTGGGTEDTGLAGATAVVCLTWQSGESWAALQRSALPASWGVRDTISHPFALAAFQALCKCPRSCGHV